MNLSKYYFDIMANKFKFERRPAQEQIATMIEQVFKNDDKCMLEAGTGVGKSYSYLIPAILHSKRIGEPIVVSTNTIPLQEQIVNKDIPTLEKIMGMKILCTLVKGRSNYLCKNRYVKYIKKLKSNHEKDFDKISIDLGLSEELKNWIDTTTTGDKSEIKFKLNSELWSNICSDTDFCIKNECSKILGCFAQKNKEGMEYSNILVVNHSMLFTNFKFDTILPKFKYLILDEAHNIENIARNYLEETCNSSTLENAFINLINKKNKKHTEGLLYDTIDSLKNIIKTTNPNNENLITKYKMYITDIELFITSLKKLNTRTRSLLIDIYNDMVKKNIYEMKLENLDIAIDNILKEYKDVKNNYDFVLKMLSNIFKNVDNKDKDDKKVVEEHKKYDEDIDGGENNKGPHYNEDLPVEDEENETISKFRSSCKSLFNGIEFIKSLKNNDPNILKWAIKKSNDGDIELKTTPIDISKMFKGMVDSKSLVLMSATFRINNSFEYLQKRLGLVGIKTGVFDSPFDYNKNMKILISSEEIDPNSKEYMEYCINYINNFLKNKKEGTFILCTSYGQVKQLSQNLNLPTYNKIVQGEGLQRSLMIENFKKETSILIGTDSFWEGIDVKGEMLKNVIIVKIPFKVPSSPLEQAITDDIKNKNGNPFMDYQLPSSVIKLRQGLGRLIRGMDDSGTVVILDNRVVFKTYGKIIVNSLPTTNVDLI